MQVCSKDFFLKTVPLFDGGDDVGMVLSPQCFHNLNLHTDIFNHSNVHFWEYMQPGYDALGFISCTGTNFLVCLLHLLKSPCVHQTARLLLKLANSPKCTCLHGLSQHQPGVRALCCAGLSGVFVHCAVQGCRGCMQVSHKRGT